MSASESRPGPTDEQAAEIRRRHATGETLSSIAKSMGLPKSRLSEWSPSLGLKWDRAGHTASAAQARSARAAEVRADNELRLAEMAQAYMRKMVEPFTYVFTGGTCEMTEPYPADQRNFFQIVEKAHRLSQEIADRRASAGLGLAKSLLGDLAAAMGVDTSLLSSDDDAS